MRVKFNQHSDEEMCGLPVAYGTVECACMRRKGHSDGDCIAVAYLAGKADGVRWCCRVPTGAPHADWCPARSEPIITTEADQVLALSDRLIDRRASMFSKVILRAAVRAAVDVAWSSGDASNAEDLLRDALAYVRHPYKPGGAATGIGYCAVCGSDDPRDGGHL